MRIAPIILAAIVTVACAPKPPAETAPTAETGSRAGAPVAVRGGRILTERVDDLVGNVLGDEGMSRAAPRVAALVATPNSFSVRVGDTISFRDVHVVAFDSMGVELGRVVAYDRGMRPNAARLDASGTIVAVRPGTALLRIAYPRRNWIGRSDAPAASAIVFRVTARD